VLHHEVTIGDEMVLLHVSVAKIVVDGIEDLPQSVATLWPCGVIHHVLGNEIVEDALVTGALASKQFVNHRSRFSHASIVPPGLHPATEPPSCDQRSR